MTYSLKEYPKSDEVHIFDNSTAEIPKKSICNKVKKSDCKGDSLDVDEVEFEYGKKKFDWPNKEVDCTQLSEDEVRFIASTMGREFCGICISVLYDTED